MAIQAGRIKVLKDVAPREGAYVLYLMQQGMRSRDNPALEFAVEEANRLGLPVVAGFGLLDGGAHFPEATPSCSRASPTPRPGWNAAASPSSCAAPPRRKRPSPSARTPRCWCWIAAT